MEKFTASNGVEVSITPAGSARADGIGFPVDLTVKTTAALREFFLHERDQELGRWRWPENPDSVVYPIRQRGALGKPAAGLLRESSCDVSTHGRNDSDMPEPVRAYFAAHPEPKPWHDAKPGEVWAITDRLLDRERIFVRADSGFRSISRKNVFLDESRIAAGRRIWPEVSDG